MKLMQKSGLPVFSSVLKYALLPLLASIYPAAFHYANNAHLVLLSSFLELCLFLTGMALIIYLLLALFSRGKFPEAALGTLLIIVFFHTYGFAFDGLRTIDVFQVQTYNLLPFWSFVALYLTWIITKLNRKITMWAFNASMLILGVLMTFNLVKVIPVEIQKEKETASAAMALAENNTSNTEQQYPDIYYLIFDEAAGFEVARQYWHYDRVDELVNFLEDNNFYVAEESHGGSTYTLREISSRLNYHDYPVGNEYFGTYNEAIGNNLVMSYLEEHGYTVIAYDERRTPYPTMLPVPADVLIEESPVQSKTGLTLLDDYKILVLQSTMLRSFLDRDPKLVHHRDMILYSSEHIASSQIPSPKFVYSHIMLPHGPFVFLENGSLTSKPAEQHNWQRYFDNYKFFLRVVREMVENILADSKGNAVIIIQSDHGARNFTQSPYSGYLQNYPEIYKTWIVNALYLPNCKDAPLSQDMDPVNTFPVVFNCYFDANIPLK